MKVYFVIVCCQIFWFILSKCIVCYAEDCHEILPILQYHDTSAFLGISAISPIAMALLVSVCLCMWLYFTTFVSKGRTLTNIKNVKKDVCWSWHLPLNGIIAKIILHERLSVKYFLKVINIWNVNISEMVRAGTKIHGTTFVDFYIFDRMVSLRKLFFMTLTYFLKVTSMKP